MTGSVLVIIHCGLRTVGTLFLNFQFTEVTYLRRPESAYQSSSMDLLTQDSIADNIKSRERFSRSTLGLSADIITSRSLRSRDYQGRTEAPARVDRT
jgi:hypothetical protein